MTQVIGLAHRSFKTSKYIAPVQKGRETILQCEKRENGMSGDNVYNS